ncbi:MAG TPA: NADH-quinone oxidoreductase subunit C [Methylocystis sp.]
MDLLRKEALASPAIPACRPWPRMLVEQTTWRATINQLASAEYDLISLWSDGAQVHLAVFRPTDASVRILSLDCAGGGYPSVGRVHPAALRLERAIFDLYGVVAEGSPDTRRWLDHGRWGLRHPGGAREATTAASDPYTFLPVEGEGLHQIPVGPVHAGIIEPGHFRFTANGEVVVRLEERLGFVHKGVGQLMAGAPIESAAKLAGRVSGDSTVAYAIAFAQAVEAALEISAPPRALYLRALMAELERLANHFGDIGAICNDASFALMQAQCAVVREKILRASKACFGHRLMMDCVLPGGVAHDLSLDKAASLGELLDWIRLMTPRLIALFGDTTSLQDRTVGAGALNMALARQFGCGGVIGRASGREFDARKAIGYAPYPDLSFVIGGSRDGDVDARVWVRFDEVRASVELVTQILERMPHGPINVEYQAQTGAVQEGAALVEGFRGDIFVFLRIGEDGTIENCHLRDPSWFQWPVLEAAIKGNIVADFPLCNKSFNCSYSGHDL